MLNNKKISIIGLGYVGLPLTIEFGKKYNNVIGFDNSKKRILEIKSLKDINKEIKKKEFNKVKKIEFTFNEEKISKSDFFIITVPTPIDKKKKPDLTSLKSATKLVAKYIKKNSIVIYESTVYPGCTEEVCIPILEKYSKLKFNIDFFCGYSPERINVGDTSHTLTKIKKVVSGSSLVATKKINQLYKSIIKAGTYVAKSIKVAEAAKVIENTQRDLNIALINELSMIFNRIKIDTNDVLDTANTKWNFIKFKPGLVGGHCIGVDPYYLTYKSKKLGLTPKIIQAGRKVNDNMSNYIANRSLKLLKLKKINHKKINALILGCAFKNNCTDTRNSKTFDLVKKLESSKIKIDIYDPWVDYTVLRKEYNFSFVDKIKKKYDLVIMTVSHSNFKKFTAKKLKKIVKKKYVIFDVTGLLKKKIISERL